MASSKSKNKRLCSESIEHTETPTFNCDDDVTVTDAEIGEIQPEKPLLPVKNKKEGRQYIEGKSKKRALYWRHFWEYIENDKRRAECKYCDNKTFASDGNLNGSKNVKKHWENCPANPKFKSKGKQTELVFDKGCDEGDVKLKNWALNLDDVREAVAYYIVVDELPFRHVEKPGFRRLMSTTCPQFHIPSRFTVARDVFKLYSSEKMKLKDLLRTSCQRISVTTDTWTSIQRINYMCLTGHFIDKEWKLHKVILNFCPIFSHKGKSIAKAIEECLHSWGVEDKLYTVTVDNASSNDVACHELKKMVQKKVMTCVSNGNFLHVRCVAHIINLMVQVGIKKHKKSIDKVRHVVKFVKSSPARLQVFKELASKYIQCQSSLSLDCPTRWNSTFTMLETTLKFRDIFWRLDIPTNLQVDTDTPVGDPNECALSFEGWTFESSFGLESECESDSGAPTDNDWKVVERLVVFLREFKNLTEEVSGSLYVTSNSTFFMIARALNQLNTWSESDDIDLRHMASTMKEKFDKYWGNIDKMNVLVYMGAILDPKVKLVGLKLAFTSMYGEPRDEELTQLVYKKASELFDDYRRMYAPFVPRSDDSTISTSTNSSQQSGVLDFKKSIEAKVRMLRSDGGYACKEFDRYLNEQLGEHELEGDILTWWSLNAHRYPILAYLARDVLAMPISTVASESAFSTGGRHLDQFRSSLTPKMVQALICTQDWIRPRKEAKVDVEEKLEELEVLEKELEGATLGDESDIVYV